jgi:hypothetical protein
MPVPVKLRKDHYLVKDIIRPEIIEWVVINTPDYFFQFFVDEEGSQTNLMFKTKEDAAKFKIFWF